MTHTGCPSHRIVLVTAAAAFPERQQYSLSPFALGRHADRQVGRHAVLAYWFVADSVSGLILLTTALISFALAAFARTTAHGTDRTEPSKKRKLNSVW